MKLSKFSLLSLVALTAILIAGLSAIGADEATDDTAGLKPESEKVQPIEEPAAPGVEEELPLPDVFTPPEVELGCTSQSCGNTGTLYGYGGSCAAAKDALDDKMTDAAYDICPGVVTGITRNYGSCTSGSPIAECKYSGNADISCKICDGQSCGLQF